MNARLKKGDWLIGNSPRGDGNRLVYAMRISDVLGMNQYFHNELFEAKKPKPKGTPIEQCGDNFYYECGNNQWARLPSRFHNSREDFEKDVGHPVFVAEHFYYFGRQRVAIPDNLRGVIQDRQGIRYTDHLADDFVAWLEANHKPGILGIPLDIRDRSAETDRMLIDLSDDSTRQEMDQARSDYRPTSNQTQQRHRGCC